MSPAQKDDLRAELAKIRSLLGENRLGEARELALLLHGNAQLSCRFHPRSHLILAEIARREGDFPLFVEQIWLGLAAPLASFSRRIGANPRRRFFGLGPIRGG